MINSNGLFTNSSGGGSVNPDDLKITLSTPTNVTVGGIPANTVITDITNADLWKMLLIQNLAPLTTLIGTPDVGVREIGNTTSINFTATAIKRSSGGSDITKVELISTPTISNFNQVDTMPNVSSNTYNKNNISISTTTIFEIIATDINNKIGKTTKTYTFVRPCYYGIVGESITENTITTTAITSGTKGIQTKGTINATITTTPGVNCKFFFAYDKSWGNAKSIMDVANAFELISNCSMKEISITCLDNASIPYICYIANIGGQYTNKNFTLGF